MSTQSAYFPEALPPICLPKQTVSMYNLTAGGGTSPKVHYTQQQAFTLSLLVGHGFC